MVQTTSCFGPFIHWILAHSHWRKPDEYNNFAGQRHSKEGSDTSLEVDDPKLQYISRPKARTPESGAEVTPLGDASHGDGSGELLWKHPDPTGTQMWDFIQHVNNKYHQDFKTYAALHRWSIEYPMDSWAAIWDFCGVQHSQTYSKVIDPAEATRMWPRPSWFEGATLNFAENLLFPKRKVHENSIAVIAATETTRESVTWAELRDRVRRCQSALKALDLGVGDRVAGCCANHINTLVVMLATTSLGAIWTAVSPDTGVTAIVDRLSQIEPTVLFSDNAVSYNAKAHDVLRKIRTVSQSLQSLKVTIIFRTIKTFTADMPEFAMDYDDFLGLGSASHKLVFTQLPAEQPIYILYSSGTTGAPKCIVHGAVGTLLQHKKEHMLQSDIRPGDRLFYYTTCMWMMWHWHVSALASGVTLVIYDGSPFYYKRDDRAVEDYLAMPKLIDELAINQFGTSAKFLSVFQQSMIKPKDNGVSLKTLKAIYSTGSPLAPATFKYVYQAFGPDIHLGSISGGTDIIADFGTPCPLQGVHAGEIQVLGLGMAVQAWAEDGSDISNSGLAGELVCVKPFPSQPVRFWGTSGPEKYKKAYFNRFPAKWHHGDFIRFNPKTKGIYMLGRSDGTLNPSGVRFGSAEIYNLLLNNFAALIDDSLCVGRKRGTETDETVLLFIKMKDGLELTPQRTNEIKNVIRHQLSPRHVPQVLVQCPEIPYTHNNKKVELAVKQIVSGLDLKPTASIANAHCLDWYREWTVQD